MIFICLPGDIPDSNVNLSDIYMLQLCFLMDVIGGGNVIILCLITPSISK